MFTKIKFCTLSLLCIVALSFTALATSQKVVDASYEILGEVHLKGTDTLAKTGDTIKLLTPATKLLRGVDWTLMIGKIGQRTGTDDSIGAVVKLICYDDSSHELTSAVLDTITDSLSKPIFIPIQKYPAMRYGIFVLPSAGTDSSGLIMRRAKMIYGIPVVKTRN